MNNSRAYRRANNLKIKSGEEDRYLLGLCSTFQPIEKHAEHYLYIRSALYPALKKEDIERRLEEFIRTGVLIEEESVKKHLFESVRAANHSGAKKGEGITVVGIPTANRPFELSRTLSSLITHLKKYGRTPLLVIADDSNQDNLIINIETLEKCRKEYGGKIIHLDHAARRKMAVEISEKSGVPLETSVMALCGSDDSPIRTGALRNSIMLHSVGAKILFTDDDIIFEPRKRPDSGYSPDIDKLLLTSGYSNGFFYFGSHEEAVAHFPRIDTDYLLAHESMLSKPASSFIGSLKNGSDLIFDSKPGNFNNTLLSEVEDGFVVSKVATTSTGSTGDSWGRVHAAAAITDREIEYSLCGRSEEEYRRNKTTPYIARSEKDHTLYKGRTCAALNLGVDSSGLLPPFAPLYRAQDGIFGYLTDSCFSGYMSGHIPLLIEHKRPSPREHITDEVRYLTSVAVLTMNAMGTSGTAKDLSAVGENLMTTARLPIEEFEAAVRYGCLKSINAFIEYSRQLKAYYPELPDYWHKDRDEVIEAAHLAIKNASELPIFWDVPGWDPSRENTWKLFAAWLQKFGEILVYWEKMWNASKKMQ